MSRVRSRRLIGGTLAAATLLGLGVALPAGSQAAEAAPVTQKQISTYVLPGQNTYPEGIVRQVGTKYFYVGSTTDGTIYRGRTDQKRLKVFVPGGTNGRTSAVGMKIRSGRLIVAGGPTGRVWVYSLKTGGLLHVFDSGVRKNTLINDIAIAPNGDAYATDSYHPALYRITAAQLNSKKAHQKLLKAVDFTGTKVKYKSGQINGDGVVVSPDGRFVLMSDIADVGVYQINTRTGSIRKIDLGTDDIGPDGMLLRGNKLYSITSLYHPEGEVSEIRLNKDFSKGTVLRRINGQGMDVPSTGAFDGRDLLVVNYQWQIKNPHLPFSVVRVKL